MTQTATETVKAKDAKGSSKGSSAKDRCAPETFSPDTVAHRGADAVVIKYCDGEWAEWGIYSAGGFAVAKWDGSGWSRYETHGVTSDSGYPCHDISRAKKDGVPEAIRSEMVACDGGSSRSSKSKSKTSTRTSTPTTTSTTSTEAAGDSVSDRCAPEVVEPEVAAKSGVGEKQGALIIKYCDGEWAQWTAYSVGGVDHVLKWNGSGWSEYESHGVSQPSGYACFDLNRAEQDGVPAAIRSDLLACDDDS